MSFFEFFIIIFVFTFITTKKDVNKLKKTIEKFNKHIKKAKNLQMILQSEINNFLTKTTNLSTKVKKSKEEKISFVENDFTTKLIIPKQNQLKPNNNNGIKKLSTKSTKQTKII